VHRVGQSLNNVKRGIKSWDVNRFMVYLLSSHPINNILNTQTTYENIISKGDKKKRDKKGRELRIGTVIHLTMSNAESIVGT